jgi:hypothetical protein
MSRSPWHDGSFAKWAEKPSEGQFPYKYDMGVTIGVPTATCGRPMRS